MVPSATRPIRATKLATLTACSVAAGSGVMASPADPHGGGVHDRADQLGVAHAGGRRGFRDEAQLGQSGHGVHLEAHRDAVLAEAKVDARDAAAAKRPARPEAEGDEALAHLGLDRRGYFVAAR